MSGTCDPARGARRAAAVLAAAAVVLLAAAAGFAQPAGRGAAPPALRVSTLRVEHLVEPFGLDVRRPRLSWRIEAEDRDVVQAAYQIQVAESEAALARAPQRDPGVGPGRVGEPRGTGLVWDSGKVVSGASVLQEYAGRPLRSSARYVWRVRVWDARGRASAWSAPGWWEMGLLEPADWSAPWIRPAWDDPEKQPAPAPMLRGRFRVRGPVRRARAYVTSLGLYELHVNGKRVGNQVLTPGWTSYNHRLQYQTYDVTRLIRPGDNAAGAILGDGWYRGTLAWDGHRNIYGRRLALRLQILVEYADGRVERAGTNADWKAATGPILASDIYGGETYDARLERDGWSTAQYDDSDWKPVRLAVTAPPGPAPGANPAAVEGVDGSPGVLVAPVGPPVRPIEEIRAVGIVRTPAGDTVFDMGQNLVGWVRLRVRGPRGTTVTLRHAEVLDKDGNFYVANLRGAAQTDRYVLKGGGDESFEPHFTFHGFRYVAVSGYPGEPGPDAVTGVVVHSDLVPTGRFETSNPALNQLQHNIVWGQRGNFVDVPTDCPQRDERLGWTGDAQVFSRTASFNMDVAGFFTRWLRDLRADQHEDGSVPFVIPDVLGAGSAGAAGWADSAVIVPWTMYLVYGDARVLEEQFESMAAWVEYARRSAGPALIWRDGAVFGDWLAFASTDSSYPGATTGKDLLATAYLARSADLVARAARIIGREADARRYAALFEEVRAAFTREFVSPAGRVGENTQTAYAIALAFDLVQGEAAKEAARRLADDVRRHGHLTTGFLGTPHLTHVLSRFGYRDVAFGLLMGDKYPSWLYPVTRGATTMWERWDGIRPDGSFQDAGMNSFNHYAFGAIGDWMYQVLGGIDLDPAAPGYKRARIAPRPGGGVTSARAEIVTLYGPLSASWSIDEGGFHLDVVVPPNTSAEVTLAGARADTAREGGRALAGTPGIRQVRQQDGDVVVEVGSGRYVFTVPRNLL
jgi:alpha-L-rhamnosidase